MLLKENYRISRNIRMVWFFNNILKDITKLTEKVCIVIFNNLFSLHRLLYCVSCRKVMEALVKRFECCLGPEWLQQVNH